MKAHSDDLGRRVRVRIRDLTYFPWAEYKTGILASAMYASDYGVYVEFDDGTSDQVPQDRVEFVKESECKST